ncbi:4'-phosphopantetheinyl transferase family protein [Streptomyces albidoflavus]
MDDAPARLRLPAPSHVRGPAGPWHPVRTAMERTGVAVVHTTWGEWLPAALTDAALRPLLGRDWQRYRRTADPTVRHRFVASRLALKCTAAAALGTDPGGLDLAYGLGGRPYLRGLDQIDVSLTHAGELIAVGVSRHGRIGVDTEPLARGLDSRRLGPYLCTAAELRALQALPADARDDETLRLWTLKEAYSKALGQGLRIGFTEFGFGRDGTRLLTPEGTAAAGHGQWVFATHRVLDRHLLSVAAQDAGLDPSADIAVRTALDEGIVGAVAELLG